MAEVEGMAYWNCAGLVCWGQTGAFFHYRKSKVQWRRFVMGRSSATLNRVLMDNKLQRNKWTERDLLKAAQVTGAGTGPTKTLSWTKAVKKARTSEAGR